VVSVTPGPRFTSGERTTGTYWVKEAEGASELVWTQRLEVKKGSHRMNMNQYLASQPFEDEARLNVI
jgi:hypothetical protein